MKPKIFHIGLCVNPPPLNGLQKAFIQNSSNYVELSTSNKNLNQEAIQIAQNFRPDIVFMQVQAPGVVSPDTVRAMKEAGAFIVNWNGDVRDSLPQWMVDCAMAGVDVTAFTNMRDVREMRRLGFRSEWVEIGYDPEIYCPEGPHASCRDIVFFGNNVHGFPMSQFRNAMCGHLSQKYGDAFGSYGMHSYAVGNFNHSQRDEAAAYRSARIAINVSHYEIEKYSSDRLLRILGTGRPICLAKWYPGIEEIFADGDQLRFFRTLEDLFRLIDYYRHPDNESERSEIVKRGQFFVFSNFTFDNQVKNIIQLYNNGRN